MKIINLFILLIISISIASALENNIEIVPLTLIKDDIVYVNHSRGNIRQYPSTLLPNEEAIISFTPLSNDQSYDLCYNFYNYNVTIEEFGESDFFGLIKSDLRGETQINRLRCMQTFSTSKEAEFNFRAIYHGEGIIKYDIYILPSKYKLDFDSAAKNNDLIILDPYLIGELGNNLQYYLKFNNSLYFNDTDYAAYRVEDDYSIAGYDFRFNQNLTDIFNAYDLAGTASIQEDGLYFDNTTTVNTTDIDSWADELTIIFWIKAPLQESYDRVIESTGEFYISQQLTSTGLRFRVYNSSGDAYNDNLDDVFDDTWHFISARYNGSHLITCRDGLLDCSAVAHLGNIRDNNQPITLGGNNPTTPKFMGTLRELYIYNRSLSDDEIIRYYNMGNYTTDKLGVSNQALSMKGDNEIILLRNLGYTDDFSIAAWVYIPTGTNAWNTLAGNGLSRRLLIKSDGQLWADYGNNYFSSDKINLDQWQHITYVYNGSHQTFYINGIQDSGGWNSDEPTVSWAGDFYIGSYNPPDFTYPFNGSMDELIFFNRSISQDDINLLVGGFGYSLNITVRDEETDALITEATLEYYNSTYSNTIDTTTGYFFINGLNTGDYTYTFTADNYTSRSYFYDLGVNQAETTQETAYLTGETGTVIFTYKNADTSQIIEGVEVTMDRFIGGNWVAVDQSNTDVTGRVEFTYTEGVRYRISSSASGYVDKSFILDPVIFDSYTVNIDPTSTITDSLQNLGLIVSYTPKQFTYNDTGTFNLTIYAPGGELTNYSLYILYGSEYDTYSGSNPEGGTLQHNYNLSNQTAYYFTVIYDYYTPKTGYKRFSYPYRINNITTGNTIEAMKDNAYGIGLFERVIISVVIALILAGIVGSVAGIKAGGVVSLIILGAFSYIGFMPIWAVVLSYIIGFILLVKGGSN